jgi:hypothetical protein
MASIAWGLVCASTEEGPKGARTARRVFQVIQTPFVPAALSITFLVCFRGRPGEIVAVSIRLRGPKGAINPPGQARHDLQIGADGTYFLNLHLRNFAIDAFGDYHVDFTRVGASAPMTTVSFTVAESSAGVPGSLPN